jgi:DNA-directed RNA polymerase subunit M/transcription elongation factor TFIIS
MGKQPLPKYRIRSRQKFNEYLYVEHSIELDKCIQAYTKEYIRCNNYSKQMHERIYSEKSSNILYNLDLQRNPNLLLDILEGEIKIKDLPYMKPKELNRRLWLPITKKNEYIEFIKKNEDTTDAYQCRKCKQRKCKTNYIQTRSCDEPMTIFVHCQVCNTSFKIY